MSDFETRRVELERELTHGVREHVVTQLRALHEAWARAILEVEPSLPVVEAARSAVRRGLFVTQAQAASHQLDVAVRWQWRRADIETEPLLTELRALQIARAWLLLASPLTIAEARALATEVSKDTRVDELMRTEARALLTQLNGPMSSN